MKSASSGTAEKERSPTPRHHCGRCPERVTTKSMAPSPSRSSALIARVAAAGNSTRSKRNPPRFHSSVTGARSPARAMSIRPSPSRSANATPAPLPSNICGGSPSISVAWGRSWRTNPPLHAGATAHGVCATSTGTTSAPAAAAASRPATAMAAPTPPGAARLRATRPRGR